MAWRLLNGPTLICLDEHSLTGSAVFERLNGVTLSYSDLLNVDQDWEWSFSDVWTLSGSAIPLQTICMFERMCAFRRDDPWWSTGGTSRPSSLAQQTMGNAQQTIAHPIPWDGILRSWSFTPLPCCWHRLWMIIWLIQGKSAWELMMKQLQPNILGQCRTLCWNLPTFAE